jgi:CRP-like cAMP-binding protein
MANGIAPGLLEDSQLFRGLGAEALSASTASASRLNLRSGAQLLKQGDPPGHLFLVEWGRVKMTVVTPEGSQLTLRFMSHGDIIGCAAVFRGVVYPATATAVEDTSLLCWTASQINDLVKRFPQLASNALAIVGGRAEEFLQRLREATTERVEQRIARALLRTASGRDQARAKGRR